MVTDEEAVQAAVNKAIGGETPKLLYGIEEATHATGIGRSKLYELMAAGELESIKCGKRRLIPADSLVAFIAKLREAA